LRRRNGNDPAPAGPIRTGQGRPFCHELQHAIRYTLGKDEHDETEVDSQGNLLHQFLEQYGKG
jgi:hypothetical protein